MIRSLGSSIVAKASPGSRTRDTIEGRINKPALPSKGDPGTLDRQLAEETKITPVPAGSDKIVRVSPGVSAVESANAPAGIADPQSAGLLAGAMGVSPLRSAAPKGSNAQALFQGGILPDSGAPAQTQPTAPSSPAAPTKASTGASGGRTAVSRSAAPSNEVGQDLIANLSQPQQYPSASPAPQAVQVRKQAVGLFPDQPTVVQIGSRVSADNGQAKAPVNVWTPTTGQYLAGAAGNIINKASTALNNALGTSFQLAPGGLGAQLQTFGGSPSPAAVGQGSVSKAASAVVNGAKNVANNVKQGASNLRSSLSNAVSNLRSLFK